MKISIRNKLTALILTICLSGVMIIWIGTIAFFKPMYYAMTQAEISSMLSKTIKTLSQADGELTDDTVDKIKSYINGSFCIEIADEFGNGLVLMEGIGDGCQLHGEGQEIAKGNIYSEQKKLNTVSSVSLRNQTRTVGRYVGTLTDDFDNKQAVQGKYWNNKYTVIVSASIAQTDGVIRIVTQQLKTVTFITLHFALVISAVASKIFIKPIMELSKATKEVAKGNYDADVIVPESSNDEFGQLVEDFNTMVKEIKDSQEMQKELVSGITHDLRTPLTIIKGYAESIRDITGDHKEIREQQLNTIIDETDRLSKMVNSVLDYTKLSRGAYKLNIVQYNMADMCLDIVDIYSDKAKKEGKSISYEGPELVYVMADAQLIERVMHNFVSNALLHTPEGTAVLIKLRILENGKVRVSVIDSGDGISREDQKHLFDRYYRSRKEDGKQGTGLGLAVVKTILENHKFKYGVNSEEGKGSEFWFEM